MVTLTNRSRAKVIVPQEWNEAPALIPEWKSKHITLVMTVSADGGHITPCVILPELQNLPANLQPLQDQFAWTSTDSGWMNDATFENWVESIFIPDVNLKRLAHGKPDAPVLLWIDGHGSRSSPRAQGLLLAAGVTMVVIPSHTSHILQPLDCGIFRVFKTKLSAYFSCPSPSTLPETRRCLMEAAAKAYHCARGYWIIQEAFQKTGLYPWNPSVVVDNPTKVNNASPNHPPVIGPRISSGRNFAHPSVRINTFLSLVPHDVAHSSSDAITSPTPVQPQE